MTTSDPQALQAAIEVARAHGIMADRCVVLQDASTLVVRLTETLVARVVQDRSGPRQGTAWFERENAVAAHLTQRGAPIIPLHPDLPPGPHLHQGYPLNFWRYMQAVEAEPEAGEIGRTLRLCHEVLASLPQPLPRLAILHESLGILEGRALFPPEQQQLLRGHLERSLARLEPLPLQPLHGDAHYGNLMSTQSGLLWTDWEDAFLGPVEWDVASIIWNARVLEQDHATADAILSAYREAGGRLDEEVLGQCMIARAAVMTAWYPILYPRPDASRREKLQQRLRWLAEADVSGV